MTARLAVKFADELNLVFITADEVRERLPLIRARCEEAGRDPSTLRLSLYCRDEDVQAVGQERIDVLGDLAAAGLDRLAAFPGRWDPSTDGLARFAEDVTAAGLALG